jgi:protein TonB
MDCKGRTIYRFARFTVLAVILVAGLGICQDTTKKVSKAEALQAATFKAQPDYPAIARQLRVEGVAELEAVVGENGKVEKVNIVSGNPMLTRPAVDALRRWTFTPFSEDGKAVKALAPVSFTFKL